MDRRRFGHDTDDPNRPRTEDVLIHENVDFASMLLPDNIVEGLYSANFKRPSPIQLKAVPLARCGFDLIVQAKSGTGKTLVYGIAALDVVKTDIDAIQVLIVAPTREIALQTKDVIAEIGSNIEGLQVKVFIGGLDLKQDRREALKCHIAVVTPGRAYQLLETGVLSINRLRVLVLDEADKLVESSFQRDILYMLHSAPRAKQVILACATISRSLPTFIEEHMNEPMRVTATGVEPLTYSVNDVPKVLLGVKQFIGEVDAPANIAQQMRKKADKLIEILKGIRFNQCIVFSNFQLRAESICNMLTGGGWPAVSICGKQAQSQRTAAITGFKAFRFRVLLSTDLSARGLDVHGVSLVVNLDVPYCAATYLHRMGRAGRYGSNGVVISLITGSEELTRFRNILFDVGGPAMAVRRLPAKLSALHDAGPFETIDALPPEDDNANGKPPSASRRARQADPDPEVYDNMCSALLGALSEPKPDLDLRSYEDLESSSEDWTPERPGTPMPFVKNDNLMKYAPELARSYDDTQYDEDVVRSVLDKNWSDESSSSGELEASSESEPSDSSDGDSSAPSIPVPELKLRSPRRKTVTVNVPESASSRSSCRSNRKSAGPAGRCCNHVCENAQRNGSGENAFSQSYSDAHAQWYSNWESQLSHIRFYVEYMEYWRNSYMNMYGKSDS